MADLRTLTKRNRRVKVFVRTRPTPYFAHDKLEILPEDKVSRDTVDTRVLERWSLSSGGVCTLLAK